MPNTSDPAAGRSGDLIEALRRQPLLVVLRADQPLQLQAQIERLAGLGVRHLEIAWNEHPDWVPQTKALSQRFAELRLGAASVVSPCALGAVAAAGLAFAVSPVLDEPLLDQAAQLGITLVPGVLSPSEVHRARALGCALVKLFPASSVGAGYWQRLAAPLGPLPFCIAAGGLGPADLRPWLAAGVDAVAIGGSLCDEQAWQQLGEWLAIVRQNSADTETTPSF